MRCPGPYPEAAPSIGFGFVEFENSRDAEDAVHNFNGKAFMGAKYGWQSFDIIVV